MKTLLELLVEEGTDVGKLDPKSLKTAAYTIMEYDTIETLQSISVENIQFFFWAGGGAMPASNEIHIISMSGGNTEEHAFAIASGYSDDKFGIDIEAFYPIFPTLKTFSNPADSVTGITGIQEGWCCAYIGFGNYLCIREAIADMFMKEYTAQADHFMDRYDKWRNVALSVLTSEDLDRVKDYENIYH